MERPDLDADFMDWMREEAEKVKQDPAELDRLCDAIIKSREPAVFDPTKIKRKED